MALKDERFKASPVIERLPADLTRQLRADILEPPKVASTEVRQGWRELNYHCSQYMNEEELTWVNRMWLFTYYYHRNSEENYRADGTEYMTHLNEVANILARERTDLWTVMGALGHDLEENTTASAQDIEELFGKPVISAINTATKVKGSAEKTIGKLYEAVDLRGILIKLADRLHNMRTLRFLNEDRRLKVSSETYEFIVPLAKRVGLTDWAEEMEDIAIANLWPDIARDAEVLMQDKYSRHTVRNSLHNLLLPVSPHVNIDDPKRIYYGQRQRRLAEFLLKTNVEPDSAVTLTDPMIIPIEITTNAVKDYEIILQYFNELLGGNLQEIIFNSDARVAQFTVFFGPPNDTHTYNFTLSSLLGKRIAQASLLDLYRTPQKKDTMFPRIGLAAATKLKDFQLFIKYSINNRLTSEQFIEELSQEMGIRSWIKINTPKEELPVPDGFNVLDLAYLIHTDLGNMASSALINNLNTSLLIRLQEGDNVEIIPSTRWTVTPESLDMAMSERTRNRIRDSLAFVRSLRNSTVEVNDNQLVDFILGLISQRQPDGKRADMIDRLLLDPQLNHGGRSSVENQKYISLAVDIHRMGLGSVQELLSYADEIDQKAANRGLNGLLQESEVNSAPDLEGPWNKMPPQIRSKYGSFQEFLIQLGIGNVKSDLIRTYIESLRPKEAELEKLEFIVPDRRFILARMAAVTAVAANIVDVHLDRNFDPYHLDRSKITLLIKPISGDAAKIRTNLQRLVEDMYRYQDQPNVVYSDEKYEIELPLPEQLTLLSYLSKAFTLKLAISEILIDENAKVVKIRFNSPQTEGRSPITEDYIEKLKEDLKEIALLRS